MNNNICQFYVLFGNRNFKPPQNNDVYINATDIYELKDLSARIMETYKEKAKAGFKVGSGIIFLIPNEKYRPHTEDIIKKLKVNGKVEVMAPNPKKEIQNLKAIMPTLQPKPEVKPEPVITEEVNVEPKTEVPVIPKQEIKEEILEQKQEVSEPKQDEKTPVFHPETNVYRGSIDNNSFKKKKKTNKLPVIIFIISLIFFIASLLLLIFA